MNNQQKSTLLHTLFVPGVVTILILLSFVLEHGMDWNFAFAGILPRNPKHIWTIVTYVFVHANWGHLLNNIPSFFLLSVCLFYFYRPVALSVFSFLWLLSGLLLWVVGRPDLHIGASGLIYAMASFLFFSGIIRHHIPLIAISLVVTILYGNMVWHIFPWQINDPVSWEGHLSGLIAGLFSAVLFRNKGPQRPQKKWDDEEDDGTDEGYWNEKGSDSSEPNNIDERV